LGKRLLVGVLLLTLFAAMVHLSFAMYAKGKLRKAVAQLRARGEPILPADFAPTNPGSADNGGPDVDAAVQQIAGWRDANKKLFDELDPRRRCAGTSGRRPRRR
jgi:hypothetical protein